ncbi:IclR family transcriptional regulator [Streptomyces sp. NPDC090306]|uniref:IclR family transcriptional regulator n=1 Tax=unclassified Streptomyces TaxID=2593676 RepID=UPI0036E35939
MDAANNVVGRVGALLRALSGEEPRGASTTLLATRTGLARPTAHRMLSSLMAEGLTDRDAADGNWHLGPEIYLLGMAAGSRHDETDAARPTVRRLARHTGESAFFSARRGDETVCLVREDGSFPIRSHVLHEGIRFPLGVASAGQVILAFLDARERDAYVDSTDLARTHGPEHARDRVREHIARTRRDGYAVNPGLVVNGSWGIGAAVFDPRGNPRFALSITGIEARLAPPRLHRLGTLLLQEAHGLTTRLAERRGARAV